MNNFLLSLFVLFNILWYDFRIGFNSAYMWFTNLVIKFIKYVTYKVKRFFIECGYFIAAFFAAIWRFLKWVTLPFRKATYEYTVVTFFVCGFISLRYPEWKWTDYTWLIFFFVLMLSILILTLKENSDYKKQDN